MILGGKWLWNNKEKGGGKKSKNKTTARGKNTCMIYNNFPRERMESELKERGCGSCLE